MSTSTSEAVQSSEPLPGMRAGLTAVSVAVVAWGVTSVLIKSIEMDALAIAAWRFFVYAVLLTAWMYARGGRITVALLRRSMLAGLLLAADVMLFFTAVTQTNVVNATTIGALQPLVVAVAAVKLFGERIGRREIVAALVAIAGVVVIVTQSSGTPEWSGAGDLYAVGALAAWSSYFVAAKRAAGSLTPHEFTTGTAWWVALGAFVAGPAFGQDVSPPPASELPLLLALTLVGGLVGHSMMNWGIPRVPLWLSSSLTLLIPVFASLAAWVVLDEPLNRWQLAAMGAVVGGLSVVVVAQTRPHPVLPPQAPVDPAA